MKERIRLEWDVHTKSSSHDSDRWAATDRGWLFALIHPAPMSIGVTGTTYVCVGHYLDYEGGSTGDASHPENTIHAVSCVTRTSGRFATPAEARAWLEAEAKGRVASYFADAHQGYEERKAEIRKMRVGSTATFRLSRR